MDASIIITSFNYENYIEKCIESCINQNTTYQYEVILIDDGSTDSTHKIIEKYSDKINIVKQNNSGLESAANKGISRSCADYFVRVDADDYLD